MVSQQIEEVWTRHCQQCFVHGNALLLANNDQQIVAASLLLTLEIG